MSEPPTTPDAASRSDLAGNGFHYVGPWLDFHKQGLFMQFLGFSETEYEAIVNNIREAITVFLPAERRGVTDIDDIGGRITECRQHGLDAQWNPKLRLRLAEDRIDQFWHAAIIHHYTNGNNADDTRYSTPTHPQKTTYVRTGSLATPSTSLPSLSQTAFDSSDMLRSTRTMSIQNEHRVMLPPVTWDHCKVRIRIKDRFANGNAFNIPLTRCLSDEFRRSNPGYGTLAADGSELDLARLRKLIVDGLRSRRIIQTSEADFDISSDGCEVDFQLFSDSDFHMAFDEWKQARGDDPKRLFRLCLVPTDHEWEADAMSVDNEDEGNKRKRDSGSPASLLPGEKKILRCHPLRDLDDGRAPAGFLLPFTKDDPGDRPVGQRHPPARTSPRQQDEENQNMPSPLTDEMVDHDTHVAGRTPAVAISIASDDDMTDTDEGADLYIPYVKDEDDADDRDMLNHIAEQDSHGPEADRLNEDVYKLSATKVAQWNTLTWRQTRDFDKIEHLKYDGASRFEVLGCRPDALLNVSQLHCKHHMRRISSRVGGVILANQVGTGKTRTALSAIVDRAYMNKLWEEVYDEHDQLAAGFRNIVDRRHLPPWDQQNGTEQCPSKARRRSKGCVCEKNCDLRQIHYQPGPTLVLAIPTATAAWVHEFEKMFDDDAELTGYQNKGFTMADGFKRDDSTGFKLVLAHQTTRDSNSDRTKYLADSQTRKLVAPQIYRIKEHVPVEDDDVYIVQDSDEASEQGTPLFQKVLSSGYRGRRTSDHIIVLTTPKSYDTHVAAMLGQDAKPPAQPRASQNRAQVTEKKRSAAKLVWGEIVVDEFHTYASAETSAPSLVRSITARHPLIPTTQKSVVENGREKRLTLPDNGVFAKVRLHRPVLTLLSGTPFSGNCYPAMIIWLALFQSNSENRRGYRWTLEGTPWRKHELYRKLCTPALETALHQAKKVFDVTRSQETEDGHQRAARLEDERAYAKAVAERLELFEILHRGDTQLFKDCGPVLTLPNMTTTIIRCPVKPATLTRINTPVQQLKDMTDTAYKRALDDWDRAGRKGKKPVKLVAFMTQVSSFPLSRIVATFPAIVEVCKHYHKRTGESLQLTAEEIKKNKWDGTNRQASPIMPHLDRLIKTSPKFPQLHEKMKEWSTRRSTEHTTTDEDGNQVPARIKVILVTISPWVALIIDTIISECINNPDHALYIEGGFDNVLFTQSHNHGAKRQKLLDVFNERSDAVLGANGGINLITTTSGCMGTGVSAGAAAVLGCLDVPASPYLAEQIPGRIRRANGKEDKQCFIFTTEGAKLEALQLMLNEKDFRLRSMTDAQQACFNDVVGPSDDDDDQKRRINDKGDEDGNGKGKGKARDVAVDRQRKYMPYDSEDDEDDI